MKSMSRDGYTFALSPRICRVVAVARLVPISAGILSGRSGVQCVTCLSAFVNQINRELGADDPTSPGYQEQEDDMYCVLMRPGWYNIHRYQDGAWVYVTAAEAHKLKKLVRELHLVGTS